MRGDGVYEDAEENCHQQFQKTCIIKLLFIKLKSNDVQCTVDVKVYLFAERLFLPSILVLNDCGIRKAGEKSDIAALCAHVVELDLSHNQLNNWAEVGVFSD